MTTVLVIDDSPSEMAKFRDILVKNHFKILEAMDGETGIQMAIEHVPDVILMDVVMPEMNGFQATRKITRNKSTAHIPVVIVSTKNQETDRVWGKRQGAKEYLTKPVREADLLKIISSVIPSGSLTQKSSNPAVHSSLTRQPAVNSQPRPSLGGVNRATSTNQTASNQLTGVKSKSDSINTLQSKQKQVSDTKDDKPDNGIYL